MRNCAWSCLAARQKRSTWPKEIAFQDRPEDEQWQDHATLAEGARIGLARRRYFYLGDKRMTLASAPQPAIAVERAHALYLPAPDAADPTPGRAAELYSASKIRGFMHLYNGEEAVAVGVMQALTLRTRWWPPIANTAKPWHAAFPPAPSWRRCMANRRAQPGPWRIHAPL